MSDTAVQSNDLKYPAGDPRWLDGLPKQKMRFGDAFRSFKKLTQDVEETKYVFEIIGALTGSSFTNLYRRFLKTEHGQKVVKENIQLLDILTRRDWLRGLPEGTLGRTYIDFLDFEGLSPEGLMEAQQEGLENREEQLLEIGDPGLQTFADRTRDSHDLWHIVSGYGRDPLGELCLLALTYTQTRNNGIGFIVAMGALQYKLGNEEPKLPIIKAVLEARRNGKKARWLPAEDWEALMEMQLSDVRKHLNLKWPETYHASLKKIANEGSPDRFSPEIFEKLKAGAYMPIAPDAAYNG